MGGGQMTGIDLSDINVDLTYQDGLRLSELYGQLGAIQYDIEHIVMSSMDGKEYERRE